MDKLLFAGYSITLSVMMFFLTYVVNWSLFVTPYRFGPEEIVPEIISYIPALLMLEAIPLATFTTLFLTRGGGLSYFETWNTGRKLRISGGTLIVRLHCYHHTSVDRCSIGMEFSSFGNRARVY